MDLNAPIIIIPEEYVPFLISSVCFVLTSRSITSTTGTHLVIDAGHISIESRLANKKAVQEIIAKRKQKYSEEDHRRLEAMMYDQLLVRLQDAQVWSIII